MCHSYCTFFFPPLISTFSLPLGPDVRSFSPNRVVDRRPSLLLAPFLKAFCAQTFFLFPSLIPCTFLQTECFKKKAMW